MNWNDEQDEAINAIVKLGTTPFDYKSDHLWCLVVRGFAGTGKTCMVQEAIKRLLQIDPELRIGVTAPTNKATQVLRTFGSDAGIDVESGTIFSFLGLLLSSEGETKKCFEGHDGSFAEFDIVIVDELSMAGIVLKEKIQERAMKYGVKVVGMGDLGQLNPVKEGPTQFFDIKQFPNTVSLTKIMRQDEGSPIRQVVGHCRVWAEGGDIPPKFDTSLTSEDDGVHCMIGGDFISAMLDQFDCEEYKKDSTFCRALAWTNKEVDRLNRLIRNRIYGNDCDQYMLGETLAVLTPVMGGDGLPVIFTDDEVTVKNLSVQQVEDKTDFDTMKEGHPAYKCWVMEVDLPEGGACRLVALHEDSLRTYNRRCEKLANLAKVKKRPWKAFWAFKESFTLVRPVHAMTIHKAQGQTFPTIFFNAKDAMKNINTSERARLAYVATSRATTNLVINLKQLR